jgi:hypothetical protein
MRLYIVKCSTTGYVKNGLAKDCYRRLQHHRCGSPTELALEKTWEIREDQAYAFEAQLHRLAKAYSVRPNSEWFRPQAAEMVRNIMS